MRYLNEDPWERLRKLRRAFPNTRLQSRRGTVGGDPAGDCAGLSNLISQLKQAGIEDRFYDALNEIPNVRKNFGYPPLATAISKVDLVMNLMREIKRVEELDLVM